MRCSVSHTLSHIRSLPSVIIILSRTIMYNHFLFVSDTSSFSETDTSYGAGFRSFNQIAVFVYNQLQSILLDSFLGSIADWDGYLNLDPTQADLPFSSSDDFVLNSDFHRLVTSVNYLDVASLLINLLLFVKLSAAFCCNTR